MANETVSPNMNLPVPGVGLTDGPQYATDLNACLSLIDSHSHASGQGVPVNTDGLNINADLTIQSHNLTNIRSSRYAIQVAPLSVATDLGCTYVSGVDLYFNDVNGNQVRITQSGGVAGSPGSIANLTAPASASYVSLSSKFVWQSAALTAADMDFGSAIMRNGTASSFALTLTPPTLSSNYSIVLPPLPASQKFMTLDSSGNMTAPWAVDASTIVVAANVVKVPAGGITNTEIANSTINLTTKVTGVLPQANGGTGQSTLISGGTGGAASPAIASGTYTPSYANSANISSFNAYVCQWMRVGNVVTVSGKVDITIVSSAPTLTKALMTLPIASAISAEEEVAGTVGTRFQASDLQYDSGVVCGGVGVNLAQLEFVGTQNTVRGCFFTFTYRVI